MTLNPEVMQAVERLDYRVTVGDVAARAGLDINTAQQGVLALAANTGAHMQVSEAGEIAYEFPKNFRAVLRNKFWRLRLQETWQKIWRILFYLIRISFGILLLVSIALIFIAITILLIAMSSSGNNERRDDDRSGGGLVFLPRFWPGDLFWFFDFDRGSRYQRQRPLKSHDSSMNFFEAIFSFLFGDGDPNADLEERRWQAIATVIRNHQGAVIAEQITPYLDELGQGWSQEYEDYMLPVLTRFNGRPEVSPNGEIIYQFPDLQITATKQGSSAVSAYLKETPQRFSQATGGQIALAIGLGSLNIVGAIVLGVLLQNSELVAELGGLVAFVNSIYWLLLAYGTAFLGIPIGRFLWLKRQNSQIETRNERRQQHAIAFNEAGSEIKTKLQYARQFAAQTILSKENLAYTTETDLIEQEIQQKDKIDAEWERRLRESS